MEMEIERILSYPEFANKLSSSIVKIIPGSEHVDYSREGFLGDITGIGIWPEGKDGIVVKINVREIYPYYVAGKPFGDIMVEEVKKIEEFLENTTLTESLPNLGSYDEAKKDFFIRVLPQREIEFVPANRGTPIYRPFGDMAIVLYSVAHQVRKEDFASFKITEDLVSAWGIDRDKAFDEAVENSRVLFPPRLMTFSDARINHHEKAKDKKYDLTEPGYHLKKSPSYMLTNASWLNGAAVLFYPGIAKRIWKLFKEEYYIVPLSIHEIVLHPISTINDVESVKKNAAYSTKSFADNEFLSSTTFRYNSKLDEIELA